MSGEQIEEMRGEVFKCQRCGAPLDISPETIVAICPYCGYPNWINRAFAHPIVVVPGKARGLDRVFYDWLSVDEEMKHLKNKVILKNIEMIYIPVYYVSVSASSHYRGKATVTLTRTRVIKTDKGTRTEVQTKYISVYVSGDYRDSYTIPLVARRAADRKIIDPLIEYYYDFLKKEESLQVPIEKVNWEEIKGQVLAPEIGPRDAEDYARDQACEIMYKEVENRMNNEARERAALMSPGWIPTFVSWHYKIIPCRSKINNITPIILLPMIHAYYTYQRRLYRAAFAGWDGRKVYSEEPVTQGARIISYIGALFASGILGGAGLAGIYLGGEAAIAGGIGLVAGLAGSYFLTKEALKDVEVEELE